MLENSPYYQQKEAQRRTGEALFEANRDQLAYSLPSVETLDCKSTPDYRQTEGAWWARAWLKTYRWFFRPSNA